MDNLFIRAGDSTKESQPSEEEIELQNKEESPEKSFEKARLTVDQSFKKLDLDPDKVSMVVRNRLAVIVSEAPSFEKSHFSDAFEMTQMAGRLIERGLNDPESDLFKEMFEDFSVEDFKMATLLHDVGKSGPLGASIELQKDIVKLFPEQLGFLGEAFLKKLGKEPGYEDVQSRVGDKILLPFSDLEILIKALELTDEQGRPFVELNGISPARAKEVFQSELGFDLKKTQLLDGFWRAHIDWSHDILQDQANKGELNQEIVDLVSTHHLIEGKNPAQAKTRLSEMTTPQEIADFKRKQFLIVLDQYQAMRVRGGMDHQKTIIILGKKKKAFDDEKSQEAFDEILKEVDRMKESFEDMDF